MFWFMSCVLVDVDMQSMFGSSLLLFAVCGAMVADAFWQDFSLLDVINLNETDDAPFLSTLNFDRLSRQSFRIDGTVMTKNVCQYSIDAYVRYSAKIDGMFIPTAARIPRNKTAIILTNYYRDLLEDDLAKTSDLPPLSSLPEADGDIDAFCALFENKEFTLTNYVFEPDMFPKSLRNGYYVIWVRLLDSEKTVLSGLKIMFRLS